MLGVEVQVFIALGKPKEVKEDWILRGGSSIGERPSPRRLAPPQTFPPIRQPPQLPLGGVKAPLFGTTLKAYWRNANSRSSHRCSISLFFWQPCGSLWLATGRNKMADSNGPWLDPARSVFNRSSSKASLPTKDPVSLVAGQEAQLQPDLKRLPPPLCSEGVKQE